VGEERREGDRLVGEDVRSSGHRRGSEGGRCGEEGTWMLNKKCD